MIAPASVLSLVALLAPSADWPALLGADGAGTATGAAPLTWSAQSNVAYSTRLPGRGDSSPAVAGRWVHVTAQTRNDDLHVLTLDRRSGRLHQSTVVGRGEVQATGPRSLWADRHNAASPTPVATADRVWAFFGTGLLVCLEAESHREVWRRDLVADYGRYDITFGMGASPRLAERDGQPVLLVSCLTKGASYVLCLAAADGAEVWHVERKYDVFRDAADAYTSPVVRQTASGPEVVVAGADQIDAYDLQTGRRRWVSEGFQIDSPYGRMIATPAIGTGSMQGLVVGASANPSGGGLGRTVAIGVNDARGTAAPLWRYAKSSPDSCSPLLVDKSLLLLSGTGILTTLNPLTGERVEVERLPGEYFASPVAVRGDGRTTIYALSTDGRCSVLQLDPTQLPVPKPLAAGVNVLPGTFYATPAVADGTLYLRAWERLYAIRE